MNSFCIENQQSDLGVVPDDAEKRVIRQLLEALLFEKLVAFHAEPRTTDASVSDCYNQQLEFPLGRLIIQCHVAFSSFNRVRIEEGSVVQLIDDEIRPVRMVDLLESMELPAGGRQRLVDELIQTMELHRWNRIHLNHHRHPRRALSFQALESAIVEGHQYHPSFKTRTGFSLSDHQTYGSESGNTFQLHFLAARRDLLRFALPCPEIDFWKNELGEATYELLCHRLKELGGDLKNYALLPVHPWQAKGLKNRGFEELLNTNDLITLGSAGDFYQASQSLRTLFNVTHPEKPNIKLPLDIVCTSSRRNLVPHFVCSAPLLSKWLVSLVSDDPFLQNGDRLQILSEYAAVSHDSDDHKVTAGLLGVLFRECMVGRLKNGEMAIPFTALSLVESDGQPFIAGWIKEYGIEPWVEHLVDVVVIPLWHMLVHHGIAFEAHAQNLILVHENGWPKRIVLRDFHDDTEWVSDFLGRPEMEPDFSSVDPFFQSVPYDDGYCMEEIESLRQLYVDTLYVFNLAEVSFLLSRFHDFSEEKFWAMVRTQLDAYAASGVTDVSRIEKLKSDTPTMIVESLLTKTIYRGQRLDYYEHEVSNPLSRSVP